MNQTQKRIETMVRARYPIIAITSPEEERVLRMLTEVAQSRNRPLYTWSISQGMQDRDDSNSMPYRYDCNSPGCVSLRAFAVPGEHHKKCPICEANMDTDQVSLSDPIDALQFVLDAGQQVSDDQPLGAPAMYVFLDIHPYISGDRQDPVVVRSLRDLAATLCTRAQTIFLLSPAMDIPADIGKDVAQVDFPLPTQAELAEQVNESIERLPARIPCDLNGDRIDVIKALQGLTETEVDTILAEAAISLGHLSSDCIPFILDAKRTTIKETGVLEFYPETVTADAAGGLDNLKGWADLARIAMTPEARDFGVEAERGVLLVGVPGCGKSLMAKILAGGKVPLLRMNVGAIFGSLVGESEGNLRAALKIAEAVSPCVLWIDEIEKGFSNGDNDGGTSRRVFGALLTWMEETDGEILIAATANDVSCLPPELIRRFPARFFVDLPTNKEREEIFSIHLGKRNRDGENFDLSALAATTRAFTGSEIEELVQITLRAVFASERGARDITTADLIGQAKTVTPLSVTHREKIAAMREWGQTRARPASSLVEETVETSSRTRTSGRTIELD